MPGCQKRPELLFLAAIGRKITDGAESWQTVEGLAREASPLCSLVMFRERVPQRSANSQLRR